MAEAAIVFMHRFFLGGDETGNIGKYDITKKCAFWDLVILTEVTRMISLGAIKISWSR